MFSRKQKAIYLNSPKFDKFTAAEQDFIISHELGHSQTDNEIEADYLALRRFIDELGYTPKQAVQALNNTLSFERSGHNARFNAIVMNAACYDYFVNKNKKSLKILDMYTPGTLNEADLDYLRNQLQPMGVTDDDLHSFLGFGKKANERKEARQDRKDLKAEARAEKIKSKAAINQAKAAGIADGTYQGGAANIFNKVADTAANILGGNKAGSPESEELTAAELAAIEAEEKKKKQTTMIVVGVVVVVIIIVVGVIWFNKSGKGKKGGK
jgi:hypothetical protein